MRILRRDGLLETSGDAFAQPVWPAKETVCRCDELRGAQDRVDIHPQAGHAILEKGGSFRFPGAELWPRRSTQGTFIVIGECRTIRRAESLHRRGNCDRTSD